MRANTCDPLVPSIRSASARTAAPSPSSVSATGRRAKRMSRRPFWASTRRSRNRPSSAIAPPTSVWACFCAISMPIAAFASVCATPSWRSRASRCLVSSVTLTTRRRSCASWALSATYSSAIAAEPASDRITDSSSSLNASPPILFTACRTPSRERSRASIGATSIDRVRYPVRASTLASNRGSPYGSSTRRTSPFRATSDARPCPSNGSRISRSSLSVRTRDQTSARSWSTT